MASIKEVIQKLEAFAPLSLQESYDNSGLTTGDINNEVKGVLVSLDCTEQVVQEAMKKKCNLIISHHPILFTPISKLTGANYVERTLLLAIRNDISIYAMHTNLDSVKGGVNGKIAEKIGLKKIKILQSVKGNLKKIVTYCPVDHCEKVREAIFNAGAGFISDYDHCSFNSDGYGTFRGNEFTNPFAGEKNKEHHEKEVRIESIFRSYNENEILKALIEAHPYEEVAYDIYTLDNYDDQTGIGIVGELEKEISLSSFLENLKTTFKTGSIKHNKGNGKKVKKIAVCGGSGAFLIQDAIRNEADVFVTSDLKYHQFFDADDKIILADIGHYESEQFTVEVISSILKENFSTFATYFSSVNTNPINYF